MFESIKNVGIGALATILLGGAACDFDGPHEDDDGEEIPAEAVSFIPLSGDALYPEGILLTPGGDLLVTGFGDGSITRVLPDDSTVPFKAAGEDGLSSAVGMAIDEARNRLWVANFSFATLTSNLKVFDLSDGSLVATVLPSGGPDVQFFNELTIDDQGRVYASDTLTPTIWTADAELGRGGGLRHRPTAGQPHTALRAQRAGPDTRRRDSGGVGDGSDHPGRRPAGAN